ncbi:MAG: hypothetical protein CBE33_03090 [Candidatus Pelagibacter sp. TMED273]|nr:MAG: hypothetical protein CBE33_03090 [Candidatus Pelagibacter sp. TMED273]|tara:strand:- start:11744 stop:12097 length:354 start_codon:yes stop_codon:yes gene_type:complete
MIDKIIKIDDIEGKVYELENWKPSNANQVKKYFTEKANEIKQDYQKLLNDFNINKIIFDSKMNFKPIIGKTYHLYENKTGQKFMSLISPSEWKKNEDLFFLGSYKQDTNQKWIEVNS